MRISWGYVVGVVVLAGAVVTVYEATSTRTPARAPQAPPAQVASAAATAAPKPDANFGKVEVTADDIVEGKPDAKVTMIEYASLTCPHCRDFNNEVLPKFRKDYVETGKVRYVYREFPLNNLDLPAIALTRCAGPERVLGFVDVLYAQQDGWARATDPVRALEQIGRLGGLSPEKFEACRNDEDAKNKIIERRMDASQKFQINATPTLIIDGDRFSFGLSYEQLKAVLDAHLAKG